MARALGFLIRYFSNYYTLHRSDLAARAAPLDPRLKLGYQNVTVNVYTRYGSGEVAHVAISPRWSVK